MSDMINRQDAIDALIKMLSDCFYADEEVLDAVKTTLNELPPAQPEPQERKTGRWIKENIVLTSCPPQYQWHCSECGKKVHGFTADVLTDFCSNCECKMEVDNGSN